MRREGYSGHKAPSELLAKLRRAPQGRAGETELRARPVVVLALVAAKPLVIQIRQLQRQIGEAMHAHPDGEIFLSLFRAPGSVICAATLLAEIGDCRARYATGNRERVWCCASGQLRGRRVARRAGRVRPLVASAVAGRSISEATA